MLKNLYLKVKPISILDWKMSHLDWPLGPTLGQGFRLPGLPPALV